MIMFKNIFRQDLELSWKWWHRLFKLLFVLWLLALIWKALIDFGEESYNHYKRVDNLEDRLDNDVYHIKDLLQYWELFTNSNWGWEENSWNDSNIYCSNNLDNVDNIKYIIDETWIDNFNRLRTNKNNIDIESFSMMLRSSQVKCIITDNAEIDFLNPMREFDSFWFYQKSKLQYLIDWLVIETFLMNLWIYLLAVYIAYYKILLYIIYWKKNEV